MACSISLSFHSLSSLSLPSRRPHTKLFLPLRAEAGKVNIQQAAMESSAVLRRPVVSAAEEKEEAEEVVTETEEEEDDEEEEGGVKREWVDWEDMILEDTVPLVGFVRMILHSGRYANGDRLSPEHETAILERLLPFHPQHEAKIGCGIDHIIVGLHPEFKRSRCLHIVRKDGEVVDFSFWKCVKGLIRKKYPLYAENFIRRHFRKQEKMLRGQKSNSPPSFFKREKNQKTKTLRPFDISKRPPLSPLQNHLQNAIIIISIAHNPPPAPPTMASSTSLQRLVFPSPNSHHRRLRRPSAALQTSTPSPTSDSSDNRLEPRVEERQGFFVLKEKFRTGINPQEKVKIEKEPMNLFMQGGINELATLSMEEIDKTKTSKDDVDVRLKWLGLFHRRKHSYGRFMMRLKLPNGVTTSNQTRYLASVIEKYGDQGCADVTTRQNWQIRGVTLPDVPEIMEGLVSVGLTSLQSGMDNVRNPVGNPLAGIDPFEIVDTRPHTNLLSSYVTGNFKGNPTITNLPRKWNVCVIGSHDLYEHPHINDLAYMPAVKNGKLGFNVLVGGFFSPKRCAEAIPLDAWVPAEDVVPLCKAVLEAYRDLGTRGNRQKTRMMWLIDELGVEVFKSEVAKRMPSGKLESAAEEDLIDKKWERRDYLGVHAQKQPGFSFVGLHIPVGRLQASDMFELADLSDKYGSGELRLTVEQNIIIPNVKNSELDSLLKEPLLEKFSPEPSLLMRSLVACTGSQFCGQAIIETKARALKVTEEVERQVSVDRPVRMHWTGCPNTCGQVQVADIGFMGTMTRDENGKVCEGVDVFLGGRIGSDSHIGEVYKKGVPCKDLVPVVADILVEKFGGVRRVREEDEE